MAYKLVAQRWSPVLGSTKKKYIADTESDIASLPKCCTGSTAIVADSGVGYMVNASGVWVKSGAALLTIAEEVAF